jgi:hypothetical protein
VFICDSSEKAFTTKGTKENSIQDEAISNQFSAMDYG